MNTLTIIGIVLLIILGIITLVIWYDINKQKHSEPIYSKEVLEKLIQNLEKRINYKIANDEDFRLQCDLDYLEFYKNELKKYQK